MYFPGASNHGAGKKVRQHADEEHRCTGHERSVLGFPEDPFYGFIAERFGKKGEEIVSKNKQIFKDGYDVAIEKLQGVSLGALATPPKKDQLYLLGNEAAALGAISAGARFMASYPITPASEIMEYMIKVVHKINGTVVQTEDELSSCMMAMGAGYAAFVLSPLLPAQGFPSWLNPFPWQPSQKSRSSSLTLCVQARPRAWLRR